MQSETGFGFNEREFAACKGSHGPDYPPCKIWVSQRGDEKNGWRRHYDLKLHYNHRLTIKRAFANAFWLPHEKVWTIPWEGEHDNLGWRYGLINREIERESRQPQPQPQPPQSQPQLPRGYVPPDPCEYAGPREFRTDYYGAPSEFSARPPNPASYGQRRPEAREPSPPPKKRVSASKDGSPTAKRVAPEPAQDEHETEDEMDLEPESRPVPSDCRVYANEQVTYYERDHRSSIFEALIVRERTFPTHVTCVTIYGKVAEVEAYFAGRFLSSKNGPSYVSLAHTENKYHDRGLRVVAAFI